MNRKPYPSDFTDAEWVILEPVVPPAKLGGHPRTVDMRAILNGIFVCPMTPGMYQLHLFLNRSVIVEVGRLGRFMFLAGRYIYTGSARGGLEARIARHRRKEKKLHWHIDYLLRYTRIEDVMTYPLKEETECGLNTKTLTLPGARVIVPRFGASDCRCPSHLVYLG